MSKQNTRKKVSYLYATLGIALVLFLIGFFGTMLLYAHQNLELSQDKIPVIVEIKETADSAALIALPLWLKKQPFLKEETLRLVRKEEKLKEFMAEYGNDEAIDATLIPFPDSYEFRLAPEWLGKNKTATMKTEIKKN